MHDTVEDTPYTLTTLRRDFGSGIATLVADHMALDQISGGRERKIAQAMTAITSADARVAALKMADRLHNMRTLQFLPQETQLRKAREVLDFFSPVARQISISGQETQQPEAGHPWQATGPRAAIAVDSG